jgi:hypothetical protein
MRPPVRPNKTLAAKKNWRGFLPAPAAAGGWALE